MYAITSLEPETATGRLLVVALGAAVLVLSLVLVQHLYSPPFYRGFLVAVGIFFSFDMVVFHWIFRLHRITEGEEANVIEPVVVAIGVGFVIYGLRYERRRQRDPTG